MLRITAVAVREGLVLKLEGRLAGDWVQVLDTSWQSAAGAARGIVIDLSDVSHVDGAGAALLDRLCRAGARLRATNCAMRELVRELEEG